MEPIERHNEDCIVFSSSDMMLVDTCSLVLSSKNIAHRINRRPDGSASIIVSGDMEQEAGAELRAYFRENRNWPPPELDLEIEPLSTGLPTVLVMGALVALYWLTGPYQSDLIWFAGGASNSSAILQNGEYFRLVTALCLHADLSHLAGNVLIGGFLLYFHLQISGTGLGLLSLLCSAAAGNYVNVLIHGPGHISVGFSTAVFAMIGLLAAHQIFEQKRMLAFRLLVPLMAGAGLLAMLGSSGARTDLGAHLFGLLAGIVLGVGADLLGIRQVRKSSFIQTCSLLASILIVMTCWNLALSI